MEARLIERNDPQVPKCELWIYAWFDGDYWYTDSLIDEKLCDSHLANKQQCGSPTRKFHLSDEVPEGEDAAVNRVLDEVANMRPHEEWDDDDVNAIARRAYRAGLRAKGGA